MDQRFFRIPWAFTGDRIAPPEAQQPDGSVSYTQGFGPLYEADPDTNPNARPVPRDETNGLYYDLTLAVGAIQREGAPEFIAASDNGGTAYPYARGAAVRWRTGPGAPLRTYISRVDNNTATPANATNWAPDIFEAATNPEALAGSRNDVLITPASLAAALAASGVSIPQASTAVAGIQRNATNAEAVAGAMTDRTVTPAALSAWGASTAVLLTGDQTIAGAKTFTGSVRSPVFAGSAGITWRPNGPASSTGEVTLGTGGLLTVPAGGGFNRASSRTIKLDLGWRLDALATVDAIVPCRFEYTVIDDPVPMLGFYAEDVLPLVPEAVTRCVPSEGQPSPLTLDTDQLVPVLWQAVRELAAEVRELRARVEG